MKTFTENWGVALASTAGAAFMIVGAAVFVAAGNAVTSWVSLARRILIAVMLISIGVYIFDNTPAQTYGPSSTAPVATDKPVTGTEHCNGPTAGVLAWIALVIVVIMLTTAFTWAALRWHQHNIAARKHKHKLQ